MSSNNNNYLNIYFFAEIDKFKLKFIKICNF